MIVVLMISLSYVGFKYYKIRQKSEKKSEKKVHLDKSIIEKMNKMLQLERKKVDILKRELQKQKDKNKKKLEKKVEKKDKEVKEVKKIEHDIQKIKLVEFPSEAVDYKKSLQISDKIGKKKKEDKKIVVKSKKPLLCIIMDDVSFQREVNKIKMLPFKITPSIFPPTDRHPNTPKLAEEFDFYMVHVPMEAFNYPTPESDTLLVSDSINDIRKKIVSIKRNFPRAKFINNHTGSRFTADYNAMMRLYAVLKENNMVFIDSRTTVKTVAYKIARSFNEKLLSRKVFLDNKPDVSYIKGQLKKAVAYAKKNGYAIAICHPHKKTFQALKYSKDILRDVKVVYIKDIYENSSYIAK